MANRDLLPFGRGGLTPFGRDPFDSFRREMDRLFDDFFAPVTAEARSFASPGRASAVWPQIDVDESEQAYTVTVELPGMSEKDIELNLRDNVLTISGEKRSERDETRGGRRYAERSFGRFERSIPFEAEIDPERVQANSRQGVLTITLPKNERAQERSRRIEIRPGEAIEGQARRGPGEPGQSGEASAQTGSGQ